MEEIDAQLERAEELLEELQDSADSDTRANVVSFRTRIITQEVLAKVRGILDQTMYTFFEKNIATSLSNEERANAKVYFPIVPKKTDLKSALHRAKIRCLDTAYPRIYAYLDSVQPYNNQYRWMGNLQRFSNERHVQLSRQETTVISSIKFSYDGHSVEVWAKAMGVGGVGIPLGDKKIYPNQVITQDSEKIDADPEIKIEKKKTITFVFTGTRVDAIGLCHTAVIEGRSMTHQFLSLCA